jgi:hypothetical protein
MELNLTEEMADLIARKLATGRYQNAEQAVVDALKSSVLVDEQRGAALDALKHMIDDGSEESASARDWLRRTGEEFRSRV